MSAHARSRECASNRKGSPLIPKERHFGPSARLFIENREYQRKVVELLKPLYPNGSVENKNLRVYTVVFSMSNSVAQLHTQWRQKTWLSDEEVSQAEEAAKQLGHCWNLMGWKPTLWVHWTVAHST